MAEQFLIASATNKLLIHTITDPSPAALVPNPH